MLLQFKRSLFLRPLVALALAVAGLFALAPAALAAADPPKAVATVPDSTAKAVLAEDADAGHTSLLGVALGVLIVIGIVALVAKKGREPSGPGTGSGRPGGGSGVPPRSPHR